MVLIEISDLGLKDLVGLGERSDLVAFTEVGNAPLEIVESLLDLASGLGLGFPGKLESDLKRGQGAGELRMDLRLMPEDDVVVGVVSQRAAVGLKGLAQEAEMMPGGFLRD